METKWTLSHGIHRGTITSRDTGSEKFDTREAALEYFWKQKAFYHRIGYSIWFATLIHPDGTQETVDNGTPYW